MCFDSHLLHILYSIELHLYLHNKIRLQAKKEEAERKRLEALAKKKEREDLLQAEATDIAAKQSKVNPIKVTRAQIAELEERRENIALGRSGKPEPETHLIAPLEENLNRFLNKDVLFYSKSLI